MKEVVEKWGEPGQEPWSFAIAVESFVESIDNKYLQAFTEEAIDSFIDSCTESVLVLNASW
ncbi:MAG: hypothetical protein HC925_00025 [Coleofasciculaceae cyanobacterium SM2_3_26]|nr:hypothetical protein [Coleofasciculaceae cyanobacterium SM2_3_26]